MILHQVISYHLLDHLSDPAKGQTLELGRPANLDELGASVPSSRNRVSGIHELSLVFRRALNWSVFG